MISSPSPLHPGAVLSEVYMKEMNLNLSPSFAITLESKIGTSAEMWVRMQADHDLWKARLKVA